MEDEVKYRCCAKCSKDEIVTIQKFLGYNSLWYVLRNWIKIKLITGKVKVPGQLR